MAKGELEGAIKKDDQSRFSGNPFNCRMEKKRGHVCVCVCHGERILRSIFNITIYGKVTWLVAGQVVGMTIHTNLALAVLDTEIVASLATHLL